MEKWKRVWNAFLRWPGWTGWLKWEGWKRIGAWPGWKKLLFPHPAVVILLSVAAFGGVSVLFLTGNEENPLAGALYAGAFYALVALTALLVKWLPRAKKWIDEDPLARKLRKWDSDGAFGVGMYLEQFINFFYGVFKITSGVLNRSAWIGADGIYNFAQALYNLFVLQVGLLWVFGGPEFAAAKLMNSLTGGAVCLLVLGMGIYMLWRANRDIKITEEKEIG